MASILDADGDRMTVADLEAYGLSIRTIEMIDNNLGVIYVDELSGMDRKTLLAGKYIGVGIVAEIQQALRRLATGRPVKTVQECVNMQSRTRRRPKLAHARH